MSIFYTSLLHLLSLFCPSIILFVNWLKETVDLPGAEWPVSAAERLLGPTVVPPVRPGPLPSSRLAPGPAAARTAPAGWAAR